MILASRCLQCPYLRIYSLLSSLSFNTNAYERLSSSLWYIQLICTLYTIYLVLLDEDRLGVAERLKTAQAPLAADTALLVSTERCEGRDLEMCVDPYAARLELTGNASALFEILGPD